MTWYLEVEEQPGGKIDYKTLLLIGSIIGCGALGVVIAMKGGAKK